LGKEDQEVEENVDTKTGGDLLDDEVEAMNVDEEAEQPFAKRMKLDDL
jgi:hypothetical protein